MQQQIVIRVRVRMEPRLEAIAGHLDSSERRRLARLYYRWAKQLWASAKALEPQQQPAPPRQNETQGPRWGPGKEGMVLKAE